MSFLQGLQLSVAKVNEQGAFEEDGNDKGGHILGSDHYHPGVSGDQISEQFGSYKSNDERIPSEEIDIEKRHREQDSEVGNIPVQDDRHAMDQRLHPVGNSHVDICVDEMDVNKNIREERIMQDSPDQNQSDSPVQEAFQNGDEEGLIRDTAVYLSSLRVVNTIPYAETDNIVVLRTNHFDEFMISLNKLLSSSGLHLTRDAGSLTLFETTKNEPEIIEAEELVQANKLLNLAEEETKTHKELVEHEKRKEELHKRKANKKGRKQKDKDQSEMKEIPPIQESKARDYPALDKVEPDSGPRAISPRPGHLKAESPMIAVNHRGVKKTVSERDRAAINTWGLSNVWACLWYKGNDPDYYEVSLLEGHPDDDVESLLKWYIADRGLDNCIQDDLEASEVYFLHFN